MFMLRKAKEQAEVERRSQSEFLAYVCQEMRTPLNNIIGGAQVMKDQLYGPIENRKYRQYAADIYATGNLLMDSTQDLLTLAKMETDYIELVEKPVDVTAAINKALRFISDKMQAEKLGIKVQLQEPMPRLVADEFRLQQILMNLLLHALGQTLPEGTIMLEAKLVSESRERMVFAFVISSSGQSPYTNAELLEIADRLSRNQLLKTSTRLEKLLKEQSDISLELAKTLIAMHSATCDVSYMPDNSVAIAVFFSASRIRFTDTSERS
ncbi:MAG: HAMP domain-containing histidine kinase [Rickettsiales bacterium]|nr:HAMP domain-containing histidine kinase [Rickettsiales bacterium]